jgi:hypothetical protein
MGWAAMSEEEKDRFLDEAAAAITEKARAAGEWPEPKQDEFVRATKQAAGEADGSPPGSVEAPGMTLDEAIALATDHHASMTDKAGKPYIEHPLRVMDAFDTDVERMVAVLHDVLEDPPLIGEPVTREELLERGCPMEVVQAVEVLTKRFGEGYPDYIERIRDSGNELAIRVKLADIADNADEDRLALLEKPEAGRLRAKYSQARQLLSPAGRPD